MRDHAQRSEATVPLLETDHTTVRVEAQEDDIAVALTIFQGVIVSSLCVILVGLSIAMFVISEHCFAVIFLGCFNIIILCPMVTSRETELVDGIHLDKKVRKLRREKQWLEHEVHVEEEKYRNLYENDQLLQQFQELLKSICLLQGRREDEVIVLARENLETIGQIKMAIRSKAVERMVQIISSYYHPGKLSLSGDEVNGAIARIKECNSESVTLNEKEFRRSLQRFGLSFSGIYQVLFNILMGNYDGQNILYINFQPGIITSSAASSPLLVSEQDQNSQPERLEEGLSMDVNELFISQ
uniref:Uncharacterized protein n=1 Tax=Leptocylindrus danicus TaxID=163516 RepID=A0A7S2LFE0_9STRA